MKKSKRLFCSLLLTSCLAVAAIPVVTGCTTAIGSGKVISVSERVFGIRIAQQTQNQTPEIDLGFCSSTVRLIPTSTNAPIQVPAYADTFAIAQSATPFDFNVNETTAAGGYQTGNGTNQVAAQPIIPK